MVNSSLSLVHPLTSIREYCKYIFEYRGMLLNLVKRDFKGRFRNSFFGYLWHIINPLMQIIIYMIVFTAIFGREIPNYWCYLSIGVFSLNFINNSMTMGSSILTANGDMITRGSFPREVLVLSCVITNLITFIISYCIILVLMVLTNLSLSLCLIFVPFYIILELIFVTGIVFLLSSCNVYAHDVSNAVQVITLAFFYCTPIIYRADIEIPILQTIIWCNPFTYFIEAFHSLIYSGVLVGALNTLICIGLSLSLFVIGLFVFKKLERGFVERL